jgi:hypothetical protein
MPSCHLRTHARACRLGIEGYGAIPDIGNAPGAAFQEHRIGPVIYWSQDLSQVQATHTSMKLSVSDGAPQGSKGAKLDLQLGLLFGLTDATADTTVKAKAAITW